MAKKANKNAKSLGTLFSQQALSDLVTLIGKQPDTDDILRRVGITRKGLSAIMRDDEILQSCETRLDALLAHSYRLEPDNTKESEILRNEIEEWYFEIVVNAINALFYGYNVQEIVYKQNDSHVGIARVLDMPLDWFEPKADGSLVYRKDGTGIEQQVDSTLKFFLTVRKQTVTNPYGKPLLSDLYWLWLFKQNTWKFWAKYLERFGTPILVGKTQGDITAMLTALLQAHGQSAIAIDVDDSVTALGANDGAGRSFEVFNETISKQIQKVVLGQTLTSGTDGVGSLALGKVHDEIRKEKVKSDIRLVQPTLQMIVNALCELNAWQPHKIILGNTKSLDVEKAERDVNLKNAGAVLSPQYFQREYGLQDGDVLEQFTQDKQTTFSKLPDMPYTFAASTRTFSKSQLEVEELVTSQDSVNLVTPELIKSLIAQSDSPQQLAENMAASLPKLDSVQFQEQLERALYAAEVLGYVESSKD